MELEQKIRRIALANAVEYGGQANAGSVLGRLLATEPSLRDKIVDVRKQIEDIVNSINHLDVETQAKELKKLGGDDKPQKTERKGLPALKNAEHVVVRFAPNPGGAIHLGNARPAILCSAYAQMYKGKFILRFEDTDPKVKLSEKQYYQWIRDDLKWLGIKWNKEVIQSKRMKIYYDYASKLIEKGGAYVCTCNTDAWRALVVKSFPCPCRELLKSEQLKRWKDMLKHKFKEGEAVLRVKTDLTNPNPAVRDWPALRIVDKPKHPFLHNVYVWPLYNWSAGLDDHLFGVTHILRGQEHSTNETKQRFLYDYFGWNYPEVIILGRFSLSGLVLSKSSVREGLANGAFTGWDDPQLATIRALRRRGWQAEALRNMIIEIGPTSSDSTIAFENLSAHNRKIVDRTASRYFFVAEPVKIKIKKPPVHTARLKLHPSKPKGWRVLKTGNELLVEKNDVAQFHDMEVRLIGLYNIILHDDAKCEVTDVANKSVQKLHWLPMKSTVKVKVLMPGKEINGIAEHTLLKAKVGEVVQFERFGFVRIEKKTKTNIVVVFGHK